MTVEQEKIQTLYEQEKIKETLATDGAKILFSKLLIVADETLVKEQTFDPFKDPGEIVKARQLRYVIKTLLPKVIEGFVNYEPDAPDQQVAPKERWSFFRWIKSFISKG